MKIKEIHLAKEFEKQSENLPEPIKKKMKKVFYLFRENQLHPSLRLHQLSGTLKGYWSISIDKKYRIIFRILENGQAHFISVGKHSIYEKL